MATKTIKTQENQTLHDLAVTYYGTAEAVGELLEQNTQLVNDPAALAALGVENTTDFFADVALLKGQDVTVSTDGYLRQPNILRALDGQEITTYTM